MTKKQNPAQGQEQTQTIKELGNAITTMDCLSSIGFSEIAGIAKLALISLETPEGCGEHGDLLNLHMKRTGLGFVQAAKELGAWL